MAGGAAAARSAKHRQTNLELRKTAHKRFVQQQKKTRKRASSEFDKFSKDGVYLSESSVEKFLEATLEIQVASLDSIAVQFVKDTATKQEEESADITKEGHFTKKAIMVAFQKYGLYVQNHEKIDTIFKKFDKQHDGYLDRDELRRALKQHERETKRSLNGQSITLVVRETDLDFVLEQADADKTGKINRAEILSAIAVWEELAQSHIERKGKSLSCVIL